MVSGQQHAPTVLYARERHSAHFAGGWVGPTARLDGRKISYPPASIPDRPARSQSLNRLSYPAHVYIFILSLSFSHTNTHIHKIQCCPTWKTEVEYCYIYQTTKRNSLSYNITTCNSSYTVP